MSRVVDGVLDQLGPAGMAQIAHGLYGLAAILDADGDGSVIDDIVGGLSGR